MSHHDSKTFDSIIVGAGFAGLMAARALFRAGQKILVLEARDRVGGRIHTQWLDDRTYVDLGGQWIGPTQDEMYRLLAEYELSYFPTYEKGRSLTYLDEKLTSYQGLIPPLPVPALLNLDFALKRMNRLSAKVDLENPWATKQALKWDEQSLHQWMKRNIKFSKARRFFKIAIEAIYASNPQELSLLHTLFYCKSGGNLDQLLNMQNGAQQDRIYGGAQTIAERMADEFRDYLQLSTPVDQVHQTAEEVIVHSQSKAWRAKKLIICIPPVLIKNIRFSPELPTEHTDFLAEYEMGSVIKCYAIYERPFWREANLNGLLSSDGGYISVCFDNSPRDGEKGMLMAFVLADQAKAFAQLSEDKRKYIILDELSLFFGSEAQKPIHYLDKIWADELYSGGCYAGMLRPGAWTQHQQQLRRPIGRIHWAGTETATIWNGYMEGAVRSGLRAAKEVLGS